MTRDELIEKVAQAISGNWEYADIEVRNSWRCQARAAIDIVLEEAAKVAAAAINSCREDGESDLRAARSRVQSAIRALKSGDGE
jgi:hypothetical protein